MCDDCTGHWTSFISSRYTKPVLRASSGADVAYQTLGLHCVKSRRHLVLKVCGEGLLRSNVSCFNASPVL